MSRAHKYGLARAAGVAAALAGAGLGLGFYLNRIMDPVPVQNRVSQASQSIDNPVNSPVNADYQRPIIQNHDKGNERTPTYTITLESLLKIGGREMENHLYSALITEFRENLDGLEFYGSEEFFKGDFVLEFRDTRSEDLLHTYEEKLKTLNPSERRELETKYGEVINTLRQNKGLSIEEIAARNGYLGANETADRVWPEISQSWGISNIGRIFADIFDNNQLSREKLDLALRATSAYCDSKGAADEALSLAESIRNYQSLMPEFNSLEKKANTGVELTAEETKKMENYVKILGSIEEGFGKVTSRDKSKEEMEREIIERLEKMNPLYGFARHLTNL